jgi:cob(I)alamin adenosyltransferase
VPEQVRRLEDEIDRMNEDLEPLRSFILPGGENGSAPLHLARAVARRAERTAVAQSDAFNPAALAYLNRLSDHLFVLARWVARGNGDILWRPGATR